MGTVTANQGNLNSIASGIQSQLGALANKAFGQQPGLSQGMGYATNVLGGKYLNGNPYTAAIMKQAGEAAGNAVNSTFSMAGRTGGGNNYERLAEGVANANNQVGFQNYQNERALQGQALGAIPGMVAAQYAGVPAYLSAAQTAAQIPYAGISNLGQIGGLYGGVGTTAGTQPGGWGTSLLNAGAMLGSAALMSDRRLKMNIEKVGQASDGLNIYEYEYTFEQERRLWGQEIRAGLLIAERPRKPPTRPTPPPPFPIRRRRRRSRR